MKKILLTVALLAIGVNSQAQEASEAGGFEGRWFLMGQAGYGQTDNHVEGVKVKTTDYSIVPAVGYFVSPTIAVGAAVGYLGSEVKAEGNKVTESNFIVQPLARKYWGAGGNLYFFGQLSVPFGFGETKVGDDKFKVSSFGVELRPGIDYFLSNNWSIEASLGVLSYNNVKPKGGKATNSFNIGLDSGLLGGLNLGVKYIF